MNLEDSLNKLINNCEWQKAIKLYTKSGESVKTPDVKSLITVAYNNFRNNEHWQKSVEILTSIEGQTSNELKRLYRLAYAYWQLNYFEKCIDTANIAITLAKINPELDVDSNAKDCKMFRKECQNKLDAIAKYNTRVYTNEDIDKVIAKMRELHGILYNAVTLTSAKHTVYDSKVGGVPYNPEGFNYPTTKEGKPMRLLAQINLDEMPALPHFPTTGMLQFYLQSDNGGIYNAEQEYSVIYHEVIDKSVTQQPLAKDVYSDFTDFPFHDDFCRKIEFEQKAEILIYGDDEFNDVFEKAFKEVLNENITYDELYEKDQQSFERIMNANCTYDCRIAGSADFAQEHLDTAEKNIQLFQLNSPFFNDDEYINWGDDGLCHFFIKQDDLVNKKFDDILFCWDCY